MLKIIRSKTKEEQEENTIIKPIKCLEYQADTWWICDECRIVFAPDDIVLLRKKHSERKSLICPLAKEQAKLEKFFNKKSVICHNDLYSGDYKYFRQHYVLRNEAGTKFN